MSHLCRATVILALGLATSQAWSACPRLLDQTYLRLQDEKPQSLCQYSGKVILVVNTASFCGYTRQYKGLEKLNERLGKQGFVVLGFPSNDFSQEPGGNKEIADFCENTFGVRFPMFTKATVSGTGASPLFRQLREATGQAPQWNFHKYLIGRDGTVVGSYPSSVEPEDRKLIKDIETQLAKNKE